MFKRTGYRVVLTIQTIAVFFFFFISFLLHLFSLSIAIRYSVCWHKKNKNQKKKRPRIQFTTTASKSLQSSSWSLFHCWWMACFLFSMCIFLSGHLHFAKNRVIVKGIYSLLLYCCWLCVFINFYFLSIGLQSNLIQLDKTEQTEIQLILHLDCVI